MKSLVFICSLFIAACSAKAGVIHVHADGSGDESSIQAAANSASPGDEIIVHEGKYDEHVLVEESGEKDKPIVFRAEPSRSVTMGGFDLKGKYITVAGFEITGDGGAFLIYGDGAVVRDCYIHDMKERAIQGYWKQPWARDVLISGNRIYRCNAGIHATGDGWIVENNEIERLMQNTPKMDCDYLRVFGKDVIVRDNRMFGTKREEIGSAHVDGFQTYDNNGEYLSNALFERNVVMDCHQGFMANGPKGGMREITFRDNVFARCWSWGLNMHDIKDVTIEGNLFADMSQHCIGFRPGSNGKIERNIFSRAGSMYFTEKDAEMEGRGNVSYQCSARTKPFPEDRTLNPHLGEDYRLTADSPQDAGPQWYREK